MNSIYIHIPFCVRKCAYCDFLSGPASKERQDMYYRALSREIASCAPLGELKGPVDTLFIGGGTPSLWDGDRINGLMENIRKYYCFSEDAEITIEANPGTLDAARL